MAVERRIMKTGDRLNNSEGERVIAGGYINSYLEVSRWDTHLAG